MASFNPTGWTVLVKPEYTKDVDLGDGRVLEIVQPDRTGIAAVQKGKVLALGPDAYRGSRFSGPWCKVGDVVLYARYGGMLVEDPKTLEKLVLLNDEDVKGVFKDE